MACGSRPATALAPPRSPLRRGAFVNSDPPYFSRPASVLAPDGRLIVSVYSSGAIGRLVPQDVIGLIRYLRGTQLSRQEAPHGTATA